MSSYDPAKDPKLSAVFQALEQMLSEEHLPPQIQVQRLYYIRKEVAKASTEAKDRIFERGLKWQQ